MKELQLRICPMCSSIDKWYSPPFTGKIAKFKALLYRLKHGQWPYVKCNRCGYVVSADAWKKLKLVSAPLPVRPPTCTQHRTTVQRNVIIVRRPGRRATPSNKHFKPRPAYEKRLWKSRNES